MVKLDPNIHPETKVFVRHTPDRGWGDYIHGDPGCSNILKIDGHTVKALTYAEAAKLNKPNCHCMNKVRHGARDAAAHTTAADALLATPEETLFGGAKIAEQPEVEAEPEIIEIEQDDD